MFHFWLHKESGELLAAGLFEKRKFSCLLCCLAAEQQTAGRTKSHLVKLIYSLLLTSWKKLFFAMLMSIVAGGLYALSIKFLHEIITSDSGLMLVFYKLNISIIVSTALSVFAGHYLTKVYEGQVSDLRLSISKKILKADFFHVEQNSLQIMPVLNNDINTIGAFIKTVPDFFVSISKVVACVAYMFWLSWQLTAYVMSIYALVFLVSMIVFPRVHKQERMIRELKNDIFEHINGLVRGLKELSLNKKHKSIYVQDIMGPTSRKHSDSLTVLGTLHIFVTKIGELIVIVSLSILLIKYNDIVVMDSGLLLEFLTVVMFVLPALIITTTFLNNIKKVEVALNAIGKLGIEYQPDKEAKQQPVSPIGARPEPLIVLEDVGFEYGSEREANGFHIGPFNLTINRGEIVYLSGGNGSGKTTLGKLIVGLYRPSSGKVLFQGQEIDERKNEDYRNQFAALFPDSHVFRGLQYIDDAYLQTHGERLIKMLNIEEIVNIKDKSLSTIRVSSGQQGRLSLLRSLLEDKEIYLFDEWAANQDPLFKLKFYGSIIPDLKKEGKTVIVITHDESYFHMADRIIKLEDGHVVRQHSGK
jgi:putative pyoverdin transport system ATP-binding/permease protein